MIESLFLPLVLSAAVMGAQASEPGEPQSSSAPRSDTVRPAISAQDRAALRCSAAFALVGARQSQQPGQSEWPEISKRGREFFVVSLAGIMEERGLDRPAIEREVRIEAENLVKRGEVDKIMPACLLMLQAAGL